MKRQVELLCQGQAVEFCPKGSSMEPLIRSGQLVRVKPVNGGDVKVGDIVLAQVHGSLYLHLVSAVDRGKQRVQISNNRGYVNGWTSWSRVYGVVV